MDAAVYQQIADLQHVHWWHVARQRIIASMIHRFAPRAGPGEPKPRLCDIGCGAGALLREMARRFDVTGVDSSPIARDLCAQAGIPTTTGELPDGLSFPPASFDVVVVADVLEHVRDDAPSVRALARLLRPGGILVATVPANPFLWSPHDDAAHHFRRYTRASFRAILEPSSADAPALHRELLSYYNTLLFPPIALVRLLGRLARTLLPRSSDHAAPHSDLAPVPDPFNTILRATFSLERHLLPLFPLPFGVSLIAVYRRAPHPPPVPTGGGVTSAASDGGGKPPPPHS